MERFSRRDSSPRLSVNLNKIALLRNSRRTGVPDILQFAELACAAGADGVTVHPRPDERHIRAADVTALAKRMRFGPGFELNVEGFPDERFFDIIRTSRPQQCTLVPDGPDVLTSDEGWKPAAMPVLRAAVSRLKSLGCRVIAFIDPEPEFVRPVQEAGADGIEIYTGNFAAAFSLGRYSEVLAACAKTAHAAGAVGLQVNIGHDLNLNNLPTLLEKLPNVAEASIGHELTADALVMGFAAAVAAYKGALERVALPVSVEDEFLRQKIVEA